jgi:hypothetical protein
LRKSLDASIIEQAAIRDRDMMEQIWMPSAEVYDSVLQRLADS